MRPMLLIALGAVALIAASRAEAQTASPATLRIGLREDPDALDPTTARTYVGRIVFAGLCDKLFDVDEKLQIVPQLATSYAWADPKTLIIHLRPNVAFQDGETMDAAAVKASLERHLTMPGSFRKSEISAMDHVDVVDPLTVRVVLKAPSSPFLAQLTDRAGMIVAPKAAASEGADFALHPVCAGPFRFGERVAQDHITLERFPDYWNKDAIHFDRVIYRILPDSSVRRANLQAGSIDLSEQVAPSDVAELQRDPKLRIVTSDALGYQGITINVANGARAKTPLGQDPRVRKAFELAIDRNALIQVVYQGMFEPTAQAVPPSSPFFVSSIQPPARDVARAQALLKETGLKLPVPISMTVPNSPDLQQAAEVIQSMEKEAGFDLHINMMEFAASLDAEDRGDFQSYLIAWSGRPDADGNTYSFLHTGGSNNQAGYSNATVDDLLDRTRAVTDLAERRNLYGQMWQQVVQDDPIIYLWIPRNIVGMTARLTGFRPVPDGMIRLQNLSMTH